MRARSIPAGEMAVCGMALGHADPPAPENGFATERELAEAFARLVETLA